jgi:phosphoserine aminotransferase
MKNLNELNFSAGPGALPETVLNQVQESILALPETGMSVLGMSHRSDWFSSVLEEAETNIRQLLGIGEEFHVLFLQGGATQQFSMIPITLLRNTSLEAEYLQTGYWGKKAIVEAEKEGKIKTLWSGQADGYKRLPDDNELSFSEQAAYLHYASNETVEGLQFHRILGHDSVPRVCDMSSDFLSRPIEADRFSIIYAHAQKNIGPAGVTVVLIKKSLLDSAQEQPNLPSFLDYRNHVATHSNYNTPPVFAIYVTLLVTRWIKDVVGGLDNMENINRRKAELLYQAIDDSQGFYQGWSRKEDRSYMNATFNLMTPELEQRFLQEAAQAGFSGLDGHRSLGGVRASLYNGLTVPAVEQLLDFMSAFERKHR